MGRTHGALRIRAGSGIRRSSLRLVTKTAVPDRPLLVKYRNLARFVSGWVKMFVGTRLVGSGDFRGIEREFAALVVAHGAIPSLLRRVATNHDRYLAP